MKKAFVTKELVQEIEKTIPTPFHIFSTIHQYTRQYFAVNQNCRPNYRNGF